METKEKTSVTVQAVIHAPIKSIWKKWTTADDIVRWNNASDDWHSPWAENDLRPGGKFLCRMEAKDGSTGFDFEGVYDEVIENEYIEYHMADGRKVSISFADSDQEKGTLVTEIFDAETINPIEMQRDGWQSILNNFRNYVESENPGID